MNARLPSSAEDHSLEGHPLSPEPHLPHRAFYGRVLATQVPRVLGLQNSNCASRTWGCLDRNFWHYKTVVDFPSATYQQPALGLALLYVGEGVANPFRGKQALLQAARAAMLFWARIQHRDGSFDEFYENEHSFCPTAFTTYGVSEALLLLRGQLTGSEEAEILASLQRAGAWLLRHDNRQVANQMMAAVNGLNNLALLTGEGVYRAGAQDKLRSVLASQHPEGWFPEYGGADVGYSFMALDLLGHYLSRTEDASVEAALQRLGDFVEPFVHPDGTAGGFYGSRSAAHLLPYGLELMAIRGMGKAAAILEVLAAGSGAATALTPLSVDDKYLAYFYFNSYAQAFLAPGGPRGDGTRPGEQVCVCPGAGLFSVRRGAVHLVGSAFRGGGIKLYHAGRLFLQDSGYFGQLRDGRRISSQVWNPQVIWEVQEERDRVVVELEAEFGRWDDSLPLVRYLVPFKLFTRMVLKSDWAAQRFQRALKARKVIAVRPVPLTLRRRLVVDPRRIAVTDTIRSRGPVQVGFLALCPDATAGHSASTRYVALGDLEARLVELDMAAAVAQLNQVGWAQLERELVY